MLAQILTHSTSLHCQLVSAKCNCSELVRTLLRKLCSLSMAVISSLFVSHFWITPKQT